MAGFSIVIDDREVNALLTGLSTFQLSDFAEIAGTELHKLSMAAFESKRDPVTGHTWKPSKKNPDTLRDNGYLQKSVIWDVSGRGELVEMGSILHYARIHQLGGQAGRGRKVSIPQRRYLGAPSDWVPNKLLKMRKVKELLGMAP